MTKKNIQYENASSLQDSIQSTAEDLSASSSFRENTKENQEKQHKSNSYVYFYGLIIGLGALFTGYNFSVLSLAEPKLDIVYGITSNLELYDGVFSSCLFLGAFGGSLLSGYLIQKIGERKTCLSVDCLASIVLMFYAIPNYYVACAVRFTIGIFIGINDTSVIQFIKSISPKELMGVTGTFFTSMGAVGMFFGYVSGLGFPLQNEPLQEQNGFFWRFSLIVPVIVLLLNALFLKFVFTYDTPQYIYRKEKDHEKVKKALSCIYKEEYVEEQFQMIEYQASNMPQQQSWGQEFKGSNFYKLKIVFALYLMYIFSGLIPIILFSSIIFESSTGSKSIALYMSIGLGFLQIVTCFISGELSNHFGRASIIKVGTFITIILLTGFGVVTQLTQEEVENDDVSLLSALLIISLLVLFVMWFRVTSGSIAWTYIAEICTPKRNALGMAFFYFVSFVLGSVFPYLQETIGISYIFYIFAGIQALLIMILFSRLKETKGLTPIQINQLFDNGSNKRENEIALLNEK